MLLNQYLGKEVLSVKSAESLGTVTGAYLHKDTIRIAGLAVTNVHTRILPLRRIAGNGEKITVANDTALLEATNEHTLLTAYSCVCYSGEGEYLGVFNDMTMTGNKKLIWFDKPYPMSKIVAIKDGTVTVDLAPKPKVQRNENITISPYVAKTETVEDYSFLLGKIVWRDISDGSTVIVKKGQVVTASILSKAKQGGAIMQLALSVLL